MNRRNFLKSLAAACGAAVVCPGELLKSDPWIRAAALRKKNVAMGGQVIHRNIIIKVRQQGFPTYAAQPYMEWINYCTTYHYETTKT